MIIKINNHHKHLRTLQVLIFHNILHNKAQYLSYHYRIGSLNQFIHILNHQNFLIIRKNVQYHVHFKYIIMLF